MKESKELQESIHTMFGGKENKYNKMLNEKLYLAERPEFTFPQFTRYVVFSDSGNTPWWCFMFMPGHKN